ncbi:hypothetical protein U1Q18_007686 [Sarracenia purpurea var. burkii]
MAGLYSSLRPTSSSSSSSSSQRFTSRLLLMLTVLPLTLAAMAFVLQWRGGLNDPTTPWSSDHREFPGMGSSGPVHSSAVPSSSDCLDLLGRSRSPSFPYYRGWNFSFGPDLSPKVSHNFVCFDPFSWVS